MYLFRSHRLRLDHGSRADLLQYLQQFRLRFFRIARPNDLATPADEIRFKLDQVLIEVLHHLPLQEIGAVTDRIEISVLLLPFDYFLVVLEDIERKLPPVFGIENALLCVG